MSSGVTSLPHPGRARRSSYTESPSDSQRGIRLAVAPSVNVCPSSCHSVDPQLNSPTLRAAGESIATTPPKLTPSAPSPASPTVRTEKSAWLRNSSTRTGVAGRKP
jgi:hypothetical protein